ncbi:hypothetical protein DIPPA_29993 [Diplonema papillatum]|nr:hypothetical protein DIPPA_29993 [Diplonema papillatum]
MTCVALEVGISEGCSDTIVIRGADDPEGLASAFLEQNDLPRVLLAALASRISREQSLLLKEPPAADAEYRRPLDSLSGNTNGPRTTPASAASKLRTSHTRACRPRTPSAHAEGTHPGPQPFNPPRYAPVATRRLSAAGGRRAETPAKRPAALPAPFASTPPRARGAAAAALRSSTPERVERLYTHGRDKVRSHLRNERCGGGAKSHAGRAGGSPGSAGGSTEESASLDIKEDSRNSSDGEDAAHTTTSPFPAPTRGRQRGSSLCGSALKLDSGREATLDDERSLAAKLQRLARAGGQRLKRSDSSQGGRWAANAAGDSTRWKDGKVSSESSSIAHCRRMYDAAIESQRARDAAAEEWKGRREVDEEREIASRWRAPSPREAPAKPFCPVLSAFASSRKVVPLVLRPRRSGSRPTVGELEQQRKLDEEQRQCTFRPHVPAARRQSRSATPGSQRPLVPDDCGDVFSSLYNDADARAGRLRFAEEEELHKFRSSSLPRSVEPHVVVENSKSVFARLSQSSSSGRASEPRSSTGKAKFQRGRPP